MSDLRVKPLQDVFYLLTLVHGLTAKRSNYAKEGSWPSQEVAEEASGL